MITTEIASAAIQIAQEFDRVGLQVSAAPGTPVERLYAMSTLQLGPTNAVISEQARTAEYMPLPGEIAIESDMSRGTIEHANGETTVLDGHTQILEDEIIELVDAVTAHYDFARNNVRPLVKELADKIQTYLAGYPDSASYNPTIVRYDLPEVLLNPAMASSLAPYEKVDFQVLTYKDSVPTNTLTSAEVLDLIKTGSKIVDADLDVWAAKKDPSYLANAYNAVFGQIGTPVEGGTIATFDSIVTDRATGADGALILFLAAKKLLDIPPAENTGIDLKTYRVKIGRIVEQAGRHLNMHLQTRDREYKQKLMIRSYNRNEVVVLAPVYEDWLQQGGNNAALFGNLLRDRPMLFANAITEGASEAIELWERQNRVLTATLSSNKSAATRTAIKLASDELVRSNLKEIFEDYTGVVEINYAQPEVVTAVSNIVSYVDGLKNDELDDVWKIATTIVAAKIFYYTDAYNILMTIEEAFRDNPESTIDQAVLISRICYVADYCCAQLVLKQG